MRASEWQFLCAVHEQPKSCCAIDYCCHTLDWAANVVTDQKLFPSRFAVLNDSHSKNAGVKNLVNVFRRLHRIFAHAWFQHRSVFWSVEGQTGLYVFFKTVCDLYDLLPAENYKLPPEAEGLEAPSMEPEVEKPPPQILKPPSQQRGSVGVTVTEEDNLHPVSRTNTRRHIRSSPSTGSAVTTVLEADEEESDMVARKLREMHLAAPETVAEEPEVADVPVIVEQSVMAEAPPRDPSPLELAQDEEDADDVSEADQTVFEVEPEREPAEDGVAEAAEPTPSTQTQSASEPTVSVEAKDDPSEDTPDAQDSAAEPSETAPAPTPEPAKEPSSSEVDIGLEGDKPGVAPVEELAEAGK